MWQVKNMQTDLKLQHGHFETLSPGDYYPGGFRGSKFSVVGGKFCLKTYSDTSPIEAETTPIDLLRSMEEFADKKSGTIRIRWNGDILCKNKTNQDIYLGKMTYKKKEIFPGVLLNPEYKDRAILWTGSQNTLTIGERWTVPKYNRPRVARGRRDERIFSIDQHLDITNDILNFKPDGGRFYITNFGYIVTPVNFHSINNRISVREELRTLNSNQDSMTSARWIKDRIKRAKFPQPPYPQIVVGKIDVGPDLNLDRSNLQDIVDDDDSDF
jgi:hypothetical protein